MFPGGIPSRAREDVAWEHTHGDIGVVCHTDDLDAAAPSPGSGKGARRGALTCDIGVVCHTDDLDAAALSSGSGEGA